MTETGVKPHIVLIEDNTADVYLIKRALAAHGIACELTRFEDGEDALDALTRAGAMERPPDLILLDLNLPRLDGRQVLTAARRDPRLAGIPIAVVTSSFSSRDRDDALHLGANRYVHKPSQLQDFLNAIGEAVKDLLFHRES